MSNRWGNRFLNICNLQTFICFFDTGTGKTMTSFANALDILNILKAHLLIRNPYFMFEISYLRHGVGPKKFKWIWLTWIKCYDWLMKIRLLQNLKNFPSVNIMVNPQYAWHQLALACAKAMIWLMIFSF